MATFITRLSIGAGVKVAIKDLIDLAGQVTTAGCKGLAAIAEPARVDAACVAETVRLAQAGEVRIVGKTNLHELAFGSTGVNPWYGTPRNPLDPSRIPGGSSSGSAVAVADGDADVALGTDTGGSVRIPAACCGTTGLKTTWDRIPRDGVWPLSQSLDSVGPMARDVSGLITGMQLLEPGFALPAVDLGELRIQRIRVGAEPVVDEAVDAALRRSGLRIAEIADPGWRAAWQSAAMLLDAEAWRADRDLLAKARDGVSDEVATMLEFGAQVSEADEAAYRTQQHSWQQTLSALATPTSLIALPTLAQLPPKLDGKRFDGSRLNLPVNFAGLPALALPVPSKGGLPASLQLVGPPNGEELLLAVGLAIESAIAL